MPTTTKMEMMHRVKTQTGMSGGSGTWARSVHLHESRPLYFLRWSDQFSFHFPTLGDPAVFSDQKCTQECTAAAAAALDHAAFEESTQ